MLESVELQVLGKKLCLLKFQLRSAGLVKKSIEVSTHLAVPCAGKFTDKYTGNVMPRGRLFDQ